MRKRGSRVALMTDVLGGLLNTVHHARYEALFSQLPDASVDAIITDMPYGTTACAWDTPVDLPTWWANVKRVLKPRGAMVTTASQPFTSALVMSNPKWFRHEWIWEKSIASNFLDIQRKPLKAHENILVFCEEVAEYHPQMTLTDARVKRQWKEHSNSPVYGDHAKNYSYDNRGLAYPRTILRFAQESHRFDSSKSSTIHPSQKPIALYEYLILTYTRPNAIILDPFCGSGTTAIAARNTGRQYIVGDMTLEYVEVARKRLEQPYTLPMFA